MKLKVYCMVCIELATTTIPISMWKKETTKARQNPFCSVEPTLRALHAGFQIIVERPARATQRCFRMTSRRVPRTFSADMPRSRKRGRRAAKKWRSAHKNCAKIWVVLKFSQVPMQKESAFPKLRSRAISQNREKIMKKFHFFDFQDICGITSSYSSISFFLQCDHRFHKITTTNKFRLQSKIEPKEKTFL